LVEKENLSHIWFCL